MLLTFALLGWTFWEMSGGAEFVPETRPGTDRIASAATPSPDPAPIPEPATAPATVTRAASLPLITPRPPTPGAAAAPDPAAEPAGITQARFLTPPPDTGPAADDALQWTSAADAVAEAIAGETALRSGQAQPAAASAPAPADTVSVNGSLVNVRFGPGTEFGVLVSLPRGTEVDLVDLRDGWAMVRLSSGEEGWMASYLLDGL